MVDEFTFWVQDEVPCRMNHHRWHLIDENK